MEQPHKGINRVGSEYDHNHQVEDDLKKQIVSVLFHNLGDLRDDNRPFWQVIAEIECKITTRDWHQESVRVKKC